VAVDLSTASQHQLVLADQAAVVQVRVALTLRLEQLTQDQAVAALLDQERQVQVDLELLSFVTQILSET
jgi:hypothetical protein